MKLLTILLAPIVAVGITSTALARDYKDLVAEGYRWVSLDGPYACPTKEDLRRITREPSDLNELHMVEQVRAYYLIQGALVKVIQASEAAPSEQTIIAVQQELAKSMALSAQERGKRLAASNPSRS